MHDNTNSYEAELDADFPEVARVLRELELPKGADLDFAIHFTDYLSAIISAQRMGLSHGVQLMNSLRIHAEAWTASGRCAAPSLVPGKDDAYLSGRFNMELQQIEAADGTETLVAFISSRQHVRDPHGPACHPDASAAGIASTFQAWAGLEIISSRAYGLHLRTVYRLTDEGKAALPRAVSVLRHCGMTIATAGDAFDAKADRKARKQSQVYLERWDGRNLHEASADWNRSKEILVSLDSSIVNIGLSSFAPNPALTAYVAEVIAELQVDRNPMLVAVAHCATIAANFRAKWDVQTIAGMVSSLDHR